MTLWEKFREAWWSVVDLESLGLPGPVGRVVMRTLRLYVRAVLAVSGVALAVEVALTYCRWVAR